MLVRSLRTLVLPNKCTIKNVTNAIVLTCTMIKKYFFQVRTTMLRFHREQLPNKQVVYLLKVLLSKVLARMDVLLKFTCPDASTDRLFLKNLSLFHRFVALALPPAL
jgi:hypothetical protein